MVDLLSGVDIKALKLESRFSYAPNALGYCGHGSAHQAFRECILTGQCAPVREEVKHFIVLWPYLQLLSEITGLEPLDYRVIEAYWLGNDLLAQATLAHYDRLMSYFKKQGVPSDFIKDLKANPPKRFIPSHLFQVLHVGVGKASGAVPFNLESINHCMVRWGKVTRTPEHENIKTLKHDSTLLRDYASAGKAENTKAQKTGEHRKYKNTESNKLQIKDCRLKNGESKGPEKTKGIKVGEPEIAGELSVEVELHSLERQGAGYRLVKKLETVTNDPLLLPNLKLGETVAVHWGHIAKRLSETEAKQVEHWTKKVLEVV